MLKAIGGYDRTREAREHHCLCHRPSKGRCGAKSGARRGAGRTNSQTMIQESEALHEDNRLRLRELYPEIQPHSHGHIAVDAIHSIYWEECGNPGGAPVIFLHGGPGGGCTPSSRRFFDPSRYRIILVDQRGSGRSTPNGEIRNNTTAKLIDDLETLRRDRCVNAWHIFGGSWGSTLALAYAQEFPQVCLSLTLRGIFLMSQREIRWIFEAGRLFMPQAWEDLFAGLPLVSRADPLATFEKLLGDADSAVRLAAARRWSVYEASCATLVPNREMIAEAMNEHLAYSLARIEVHYFLHNCFSPEDLLIKRIARIQDVPGTIIQGRYDLLCPPTTAVNLHRVWPRSRLAIIDDAGHSATEPGIRSALVTAMDALVGK